MNSKSTFLVYFFIIFCNTILSQEIIEFSQLEGENVSTQSITYSIKEDNLGNIWIASEEGILKHNSKFYNVYNTYNGIPEYLNNRTNEIYIDKNNNIFAGLEKGVCLYNKNLDKFEIIQTENNINPSLVTVIKEDSERNIWIAAFNGLWKYYVKDKRLEKTSIETPIEALFIDENYIIFGGLNGLFHYNQSTKKAIKISIPIQISDIFYINKLEESLLVGTKSGILFRAKMNKDYVIFDRIIQKFNSPIRDILLTKKNELYIATDGFGIVKLNKNFEIINHFIQDNNNISSISSNGIYDLELSKEGILWIATYGGGINYLNTNSLPFLKIKHELNNKNSLSSDFTWSIAKDKNNNLWFGTKKGISIWNQKNNNWKHIEKLDNSDSSQSIVLALESDDDFMWVGTYNHGLYKININTFKIINFNKISNDDEFLTKIYTIKKDSKNNIWVGGINNGLTMITNSKVSIKYPLLHVKNIIETSDGKILASGRYGIHEIDPINESFKIIDDLEPSKNSLAYTTIHSIQETKKNKLIIATNGAGLVFYDKITKNIKQITINNGLPSDIVQGVLIDNKNHIWASTTKGLVKISIQDKDTIIDIYDKRDGLASTEFNYGSFAKLSPSTFAFGGVNGVTLFNPEKIIPKSFKPSLVFEEFKLFNKIVSPSEKPLKKHINETRTISLKSIENSIEIKFTGIQHNTSNKMSYSWILEGFDENWSKPSTNNFASYTNLNSGNYIFKAKAINKYNNESTIRFININILTPWWKTTNAFIIYTILIIILIYVIIHFTTVIINKKNADDQIEFFNNITHEIKTPLTILLSSLDNITNETSETAKESNKRIRTTIKRINSLFEQMLNFHKVTSQDSIFQEVSKIDLHKYFEKRIYNFKPLTEERNLTIEINNKWSSEIFYFYRDVFDKIVLNLLSNAIKYSFENGKIIINLQKTFKGDLRIDILDNGLGIPKDQQKFILKRYYRARNVINSQRPGTGLGLIMTKKLIEKTGGNISFESIENHGTTFTVELKNLKEKYKDSAVQDIHLQKIVPSTDEDSEIEKFSDSKILIVEDNDELRELLVENLGRFFQIFEANNGKEGIESASHNFPDIIITDLIMPEMDGLEMAKILKEDINLNHIPVFMLSVLQNSIQKLESIESGISEYLEKPVDIKLLLAKILNTLKFQRKLREKYVQDNDSENATIFRTQKDQQFLTSLENKIIENIEDNSFSVHDLSRNFGMSRTSLYMKLKNLVDLSPQDFVIHTKLKHAKNLLIKGELSIKEIAYSSGFSNPKYFSTSFKKFYGKSPSTFLDSLKNN